MLFLIKTAFWLTILVLLLPTDEQQRTQIYGTAQAAVQDVTTFCDRNPTTCATGRDAFHVLVQKAQYGARMLMDMVSDQPMSGADESAAVSPAPETAPSATPALWDRADSQDTLSPDDREAAWSGPDSAGT